MLPFIFLVIIFVVASSIALPVLSEIRDESRACTMLDIWLRKNSFQLLEKRKLSVKDSPFSVSHNHTQKVFKIIIATSNGTKHVAWICCDHALVGVAKDQVEVKWNDLVRADQT